MASLAAHLQAGEQLLAQGAYEEAAAAFAAAVETDPTEPHSFVRMAVALAHAQEVDAAATALIHAVDLRGDPTAAIATLDLLLASTGQLERGTNTLEMLPQSTRDCCQWWLSRANLLLEQGKLPEALQLLDATPRTLRAVPAYQSLRIRCLLYSSEADARELYDAAAAWEENTGVKSVEASIHPRPHPQGKLRIGLVNTRFQRHNSSQHLLGWLPHVDRSALELYFFSATSNEDAVSEKLKSFSHEWIPITTLTDDQARAAIRARDIDVLVDMNEHANSGRLSLFAQRCAPVQLHLYSNATTTGLRTMDYRITDPVSEPEWLAACSSETTIHLLQGYHSYTPPFDSVRPGLEAPAARNGFFTFGGLHHLAKYNTEVLATYARILDQAPQARLLLIRDALRCPQTRNDFARRCLDAGIPKDRLQLEADTRGDLSPFHRFDAVLDTFPFCGDATTGDALWMGVPVITLMGQSLRGRRAAAQLIATDQNEWIARDTAEFIRKALDLAQTPPVALSEIRRELHATFSSHAQIRGKSLARDLMATFKRVARHAQAGTM